MYLSVVITGPIRLFNRGSSVASLQSAFGESGGRMFGTVEAHRAWRGAIELRGIKAPVRQRVFIYSYMQL